MYSKGFREAALKWYDFLGNMKNVAKALKCGVATIWRWINNGINNKARKDKPRNKTTEAILSFIKLELENKKGLCFELFHVIYY